MEEIEKARLFEEKIFGSKSPIEKYEGTKILFRYDEECSPISFMVSYIRDEKIYIWLCGTLKNAQNKGLFRSLLKQTIEEYPNEVVSVRTYPEYYTNMYNCVKKLGFVETEEIRNDPIKGRFVQLEVFNQFLIENLS